MEKKRQKKLQYSNTVHCFFATLHVGKGVGTQTRFGRALSPTMKPKNGREWSLAPLTDADHSGHCSHALAPPLSNAIGMRWCVFCGAVRVCVTAWPCKEVGEGTDCTTTRHALTARGLRERVKAPRSCPATLLKAPSCAIPCVRISRLRLWRAGKVRLCDNKSVM